MKYKVVKLKGREEWDIVEIKTGRSYGSSSILKDDVDDLCAWLNKQAAEEGATK